MASEVISLAGSGATKSMQQIQGHGDGGERASRHAAAGAQVSVRVALEEDLERPMPTCPARGCRARASAVCCARRQEDPGTTADPRSSTCARITEVGGDGGGAGVDWFARRLGHGGRCRRPTWPTGDAPSTYPGRWSSSTITRRPIELLAPRSRANSPSCISRSATRRDPRHALRDRDHAFGRGRPAHRRRRDGARPDRPTDAQARRKRCTEPERRNDSDELDAAPRHLPDRPGSRRWSDARASEPGWREWWRMVRAGERAANPGPRPRSPDRRARRPSLGDFVERSAARKRLASTRRGKQRRYRARRRPDAPPTRREHIEMNMAQTCRVGSAGHGQTWTWDSRQVAEALQRHRSKTPPAA